jgi:hypothetical protein
VQYFAVVMWVDEMPFLDPPAIVCRAWHPSEERDPDESVLELLLELDDRGLCRCECFSRYAPEGEFGHRPQRQLYPIARSDFDHALELLREEEDLPVYEEHVYHAFVRSLERCRLRIRAITSRCRGRTDGSRSGAGSRAGLRGFASGRRRAACVRRAAARRCELVACAVAFGDDVEAVGGGRA